MTATELRPLGATGLMVSPLSVGCAPLGDMPETFAYSVAEESALATIRTAFASPINFIDTAYSYGDGESERRIGLVIKEIGGVPAGYVVATKADRNLQTGDFSGAQMRRSIERSLRLLGIDTIQLLHLHDPEHTTFEAVMAPGGVLEELVRCKEEGLVQHLGVAGGPVDMMIRYVETGAFEAMITHNRYTLLNRSADQLLSIAARRGMGVLNAAPYGSGILAKGPDSYPRYAYQEAPDLLIERTRTLQAICEKYEVRLPAVALQFSMRDPRVTSTIVGVSKPERIQQTLDLAAETIPDELWEDIAEVEFDTVDPEVARWK
jgi:D-threo-aldose 1-dehydrogenase